MKKFLIGLGFCLLGFFAQAQNGLEGIVVEKYYIANAADAASPNGTLPVGSVTYRIYADMLPGYTFKLAFGKTSHPLSLSTTTTFFNNEFVGGTTPVYSMANAKKNTVMLDSWLSAGGAVAGRLGVMKSEDDGVGTYLTDGLLKNTDAAMGIALTTQDGIYSGTTAPKAVDFLGLTTEVDNVFGAVSQAGSSFVINSTSGASWGSNSGASGPLASNKVLIAQVTTDGVFTYQLNVGVFNTDVVANPTNKVEVWVASNPIAGEFTHASLSGTLGGLNSLPVVSLAGATSAVVGEVKTYTATATDTDGTIANVVFKINGTAVATDASAPYTYDYTSVLGTQSITAVATDDQGGVTTSAPVALSVTAAPVDPAPVVSITAPLASAPATKLTNPVTNVAITADATDNGTVSQVEFFVDGVSLSVDATSPYAASFPASAVGTFVITAKAKDNLNQITTSASVSISVVANVAPTVSITAPTTATVNINTVVSLSANALDSDGTVASVVFKVNNVSVGSPITVAPYTTTWTAPATELNNVIIEAIATDNNGATTSNTKSVNVVDPTKEKPYVIGTWNGTVADSIVEKPCYDTYVVRIPVSSTKAALAGVIGYDIALNYNGIKVVPNGKIVLYGDLIDSTKVSYMTNIVANADETKNILNITIFLNGSALSTTNFTGDGKLFAAEFIKRPAFQSVDEVVFKIDTVFESYPTRIEKKMVRRGKFITFKESEFTGNLKFWKDESAIKYDLANPTNYLVTNITGNLDVAPFEVVQPDLFGKFKYNVANGPKIGIERDIMPATNPHTVIMATDALAAAQMANKNALVFTPTVFTMIAADVNLDGKVTAGDASQINLRAVNKITQFAQVWNASGADLGKPSKDWLFISQAKIAADAKFNISATYPNDDLKGFSGSKVPVVAFNQSIPNVDSDCPHYGSDVFFGIMLGDVNGDYATKPVMGDGLKSAEISEDLVTLDFSKAVVEKNVITVPVSVTTSLNELHAIDLGIFINDDKIENIEVVPIPSENFSSLNFGYNADTKKLDIAGFSMNSIPTENTFSLKITKKNSSDVLVASDFDGVQVNLTNNPMGAIVNGTLQVIDQTITGISDYISNTTVYPNPAKDHIYVNVTEDSKVRIFDINGRLVIETTVNAGQKVINVQNLTNGVYMVKVYNNTNREPSISKVIIQN